MISRLNSSASPLAFVSVLLAMSLAWLHAAAAADRALSIPVQITHAENFDPFPSPDGKKLVFISMLSSREQLFTMNADGSNIVQLTVTMLIMKIQRGHRTGPKSLSFSLPRTVTALLSWEPMVATWKCLRLRNRIPSIQTGQPTAKGDLLHQRRSGTAEEKFR